MFRVAPESRNRKENLNGVKRLAARGSFWRATGFATTLTTGIALANISAALCGSMSAAWWKLDTAQVTADPTLKRGRN